MRRLLLTLPLLAGCAAYSPQPRDVVFRGQTVGDRCTTIYVDNRRWEQAIIYRNRERVGTVEGKMQGEVVVCKPGDLNLGVHFLGAGNLRPYHDPSVSPVGTDAQELILILGLTDLQSWLRQRD